MFGDTHFWENLNKWIDEVCGKLPLPATLEPACAKLLAEVERRAQAWLSKKPVDRSSLAVVSAPKAAVDVASLVTSAKNGDFPAVLDALVALWEDHRDPTVAQLIPGPRQVYINWLIERGDSRGELLRTATTKPVEKSKEPILLGALFDTQYAKSWELEGGLVVGVSTRQNKATLKDTEV